MSKLLTAEQLGEIRKRHEHVCMIGKRTGREHQQSLAHSDRQSLIEHIDALQDNMYAFQETIQSAMDEANS